MNDNKIKIYLANELFSEAGLMYNEMLYNKLTEIGYDVYAPQKNFTLVFKIDIKSCTSNSAFVRDFLISNIFVSIFYKKLK